MIYQEIKGKNVFLCPVEISDAEFIVNLRNNKEKCKYIHPVPNDIDAQKEWIKKQRIMQGDYYFIIQDLQNRRIGTIGLSNIAGNCGETSRFVSNGSVVENVEANILITDFAFEVVKLEVIRGYVGVNNKKVISLQKRFGYVFDEYVTELDGMMVRFATLIPEDYYMKRATIMRMIDSV